MLKAISPIDGRYESKTKSLQKYFSELALIKYRILVELLYLQSLQKTGLANLSRVDTGRIQEWIDELNVFSEKEGNDIKQIEKVTNHDVKAVEYFIKDKMKLHNMDEHIEWVHFALTSQDINNTAFPMMIKDFLQKEFVPSLNELMSQLHEKANQWKGVPMLARTHGQAASPTTLGKEIQVFIERLESQIQKLSNLELYAKFGGATGNMNAHKVTFPTYNWIEFANSFVEKQLNLKRHQTTTQIAHYDDLAELFHCIMRINTILIDFARDVWTYVSMDYFKQKTIAGEVGSSAMPHKVNPIDFENAEGNLGVANAIFDHLAGKLPISRLQRDLTDSTVLRNVGVPFGHSVIALQSLQKGINKITLNEQKLQNDLNNNWAVVAEAIQNILRREGVEKPYEKLKDLTRGSVIDESKIHDFIETLPVSDDVKREMIAITPMNYVGYF